MELQTIRQVTLDYGVSRRMLCYYEEIGLIKSSRKKDYAYRVYDEEAIKRLQQIIILRKLQIPVKQIKEILQNQNAVAVIEIFKQNISELDENITALSAVKSILTCFIEELQEKVDVHLKLDLLNDTTMLTVVNSLSFSENKIKEKVSMDEINVASEQMGKIVDKNVRIVYIPPATIASACCWVDDSVKGANAKQSADVMMRKFISDVDLFKIKPDTRIFGFGHGYSDIYNGYSGYEMWVTVPDDFNVPVPLTKKKFAGGLYATCLENEVDLNEWVENSDNYEWTPHGPGMDEYINPVCEYGNKKFDSEITGFMYKNASIPIKEIKNFSNDFLETATDICNNIIPRSETVEIDLTSMEETGESDLEFKNGLMIRKTKDGDRGIRTTRKFNFPLKIDLRAKSDGEICINYASGFICFNWRHGKNKLFSCDITGDEHISYKKRGEIPVNEFVDIEWILDKKIMIIKVNGEIRHINENCKYIKTVKENPGFELSAEVGIGHTYGSTITVESLRVTETK